MFISLGFFLIYGPLFLASFILSIVAMAHRKIAAGVVLLVVTLALPTISWIGLFVMNVNSTMQEIKDEKKSALSAIAFEEVRGYIDGDYMYCKGKVRNNGTEEVDFIKVEVEWLDSAGKVLETDHTYAVAGEGLRPGGAKTFEIMSPADQRMKQYRYYIRED